jgi:hypothetical protein
VDEIDAATAALMAESSLSSSLLTTIGAAGRDGIPYDQLLVRGVDFVHRELREVEERLGQDRARGTAARLRGTRRNGRDGIPYDQLLVSF